MNLAAATNENLAHTSNVLIYSAMAVYTLAFFAHIAEWVFGSRSKVGRTAAALTGRGRGATGAGHGAAAQKGGGTAVLERPKVVTRSAAGSRGRAGRAGRRRRQRAGRPLRPDRRLPHRARLPHRRPAASLTRALSVQRAPWGNMYEFSITFSTVAVGVYLVLLALKKNVRWIGLPLVTTVLLDLGLAVTVLYTASDQLVPALHSYWLWIHVSHRDHLRRGASTSARSPRCSTSSATATRRKLASRAGSPAPFATSVLERLPVGRRRWTSSRTASTPRSSRCGRSRSSRARSGPGDAWGRYWGWDPKEIWAFITWVAYACYLHARATAGWKGRKAAYLALIAFACFLFNYYGVNIFVTGKHSYAGSLSRPASRSVPNGASPGAAPSTHQPGRAALRPAGGSPDRRSAPGRRWPDRRSAGQGGTAGA